MIKHIFTLIWNKKKENTLLFLEIFFAFLILFAVFTFVIQQMTNYRTPLGFEPKDVWVAQLNLEEEEDSAQVAEMKLRLQQTLEAMPEIEQTAYSGFVTPFNNSTWSTANDDNGFPLFTLVGEADENMADLMGLKIVEGRWFNESDSRSKYRAVVISKKLHDAVFDGKPVIDSLYKMDGSGAFNLIVGVVEHYKYQGEFSQERNFSFFYLPPTAQNGPNLMIKVKPNATPMLEEQVNKTIAEVTRRNDFIIENLEASRKRDSRTSWIPIVTFLSICGFLVLNVALGLFGVLWYNINKRKSEVGLRRTLGATKSEISTQFIGEILMVATLGIILATFFAAQFPLMKIVDIEVFIYAKAMLYAAALILSLVLICTFYPSHQATQIHPALALHEE